MTNQIKFFMGEELHNHLEDQVVAALADKIENDKLFTFEDVTFFYEVDNEKEITSKYPELVDVLEEAKDLETYVEWDYECGDEEELANGMIRLSEFELFDEAKIMISTDEFKEEFMNSPRATLKKLRKETVEFLAATKIGEMLRLAKQEGFNLDMAHIKIVSEQ
ncbi:hypothetical protein ABEY43_06635 [Priestia megaterium]